MTNRSVQGYGAKGVGDIVSLPRSASGGERSGAQKTKEKESEEEIWPHPRPVRLGPRTCRPTYGFLIHFVGGDAHSVLPTFASTGRTGHRRMVRRAGCPSGGYRSQAHHSFGSFINHKTYRCQSSH